MSSQRTDAPNDNALEDFEVAEVHYGAGPLFPGQAEDWQRNYPEPVLYSLVRQRTGSGTIRSPWGI